MDFKNTVKAALAAALLLIPQAGWSSGAAVALPDEEWSFKGMFGQFDQEALKRGAMVASQVCLGCHGVQYIKFDQLRQIGFSEAEVTEMAAMAGFTRNDHMNSAMDAETAADSFGIVPPDLSLITKARKGYENYVYAIMTGYLNDDEMAEVEALAGDGEITEEEIGQLAAILHMDPHDPEAIEAVSARIMAFDGNFNRYFPGHFFAMPAPLMEGLVEFPDGTEATVENMAHDVVTFLAWAAEPTQMERKATGHKVMIYLIILTAMLFAVKRRIWARVH